LTSAALHRISSINDGTPAMSDFDPEDRRLVEQLKALAHPARLAILDFILDLLAARGTCVCGTIVEGLPLAQATVSQHLKVLKDAGLLQGTIDGPRSCYCLDGEAITRLRRTLDARLAGLQRSDPVLGQPELEITP